MSQKLTQLEKEMHDNFRFEGQNHIKSKRRLLEMIFEIEEQGVYKKVNCEHIYEYGWRFGALSKTSIDQARLVHKRRKEVPDLKGVIEDFGINKAVNIAKVATNDNIDFLKNRADKMPVRTLKMFVDEIKGSKDSKYSDCVAAKKAAAVEQNLKIELDKDAQKAFFRLKKELQLEDSNKKMLRRMLVKMEEILKENVLLKKSLRGVKEIKKTILVGKSNVKDGDRNVGNSKNLNVQKTQDENLKNLTASRHIPVKIKRQVLERSKGTCEYENCVYALENYHHTDRFSLSKSHKNIVGLCKNHHDILHAGIIVDEIKGPKGWKFMLKDLNHLIPWITKKIDEKRQQILQNYGQVKARGRPK